MQRSIENQLTGSNIESISSFSLKKEKTTRFIEIEPYEGDSYKSPDGMPFGSDLAYL